MQRRDRAKGHLNPEMNFLCKIRAGINNSNPITESRLLITLFEKGAFAKTANVILIPLKIYLG
jgi:hypothetical protein